MNAQQKIVVVVIDVLILIELCVAIYFANLDPENFTPLFFKYFFSSFFPTLAIGIIVIRRLKQTVTEPLTWT